MNNTTAQNLHMRVGALAALATRFYARYGSNYRLVDKSPDDAVELYNRAMAQQVAIASMLDYNALLTPYIRWEKWWDYRDVMNIGLVNELATEALRLVERVSYLEALGKEPAGEETVNSIQEIIAGLLHPLARQTALEQIELPEAV